ncbi:Photosystem II reaction center PSB28 protein, chloroplastic [Vitis vinifera]|uniref:Photosystem II reaction center Psb28 protein n=1 Tax=Vitis vinifera TaxID=29760 RepID=A0A438F114_VITVI|nr:Photosystem II reaction center PSB28 protein, chloroplastic [Vitis vinifera]
MQEFQGLPFNPNKLFSEKYDSAQTYGLDPAPSGLMNVPRPYPSHSPSTSRAGPHIESSAVPCIHLSTVSLLQAISSSLGYNLLSSLFFPSTFGLSSWAVHRSAHSSFNGRSLHLPRPQWAALKRSSSTSGLITMMVKPTIQFIQGTDEQTVPDVRLTQSRDGTNGVLQSVDVSAKFINGKPSGIEAKYVMRSPREWDRFMRFMERYSNENGLQFVKK